MVVSLTKFLVVFVISALLTGGLQSTAAAQDSPTLPLVFDINFRVTESEKVNTQHIRAVRATKFNKWNDFATGEGGTTAVIQISAMALKGPSTGDAGDFQDSWAKTLLGNSKVVIYDVFDFLDVQKGAELEKAGDRVLGLKLRARGAADEVKLIPDKAKWVVYWDQKKEVFAVWNRENAKAIFVFSDMLSIRELLRGDREATRNQPRSDENLPVYEIDLRPELSAQSELVYVTREKPDLLILQYAKALFNSDSGSGIPGCRRLLLDVGHIDPGAIGNGQLQLTKAAFMGGQKLNVVQVSLAEFSRIQSVSLQADSRISKVVRSAGSNKPGTYMELTNPLAKELPSSMKVPGTFYVATVNESQRVYFSNTEHNNALFGVVEPPGRWIKRASISPGFEVATDSRLRRVGTAEYQTLLSCNRNKSKFVLVDGDSVPFYLQEFEVTVGQWNEFLASDVSLALRQLEQPEAEAFLALTGREPEHNSWRTDRLRFYLWVTVLRNIHRPNKDGEKLKSHEETRLKQARGLWSHQIDRILSRSPDRPMTMVSITAADLYAKWVQADIPTVEELKYVVKESQNVDRGLISEEPHPLAELKTRAADVYITDKARLYGVSRNVRELTRTYPFEEGRKTLIQPVGLPWWGGVEWGVLAAESTNSVWNENTVDAVTGLRLKLNVKGHD